MNSTLDIKCNKPDFDFLRDNLILAFKGEISFYSISNENAVYYYNFAKDPILNMTLKENELTVMTKRNVIHIQIK